MFKGLFACVAIIAAPVKSVPWWMNYRRDYVGWILKAWVAFGILGMGEGLFFPRQTSDGQEQKEKL